MGQSTVSYRFIQHEAGGKASQARGCPDCQGALLRSSFCACISTSFSSQEDVKRSEVTLTPIWSSHPLWNGGQCLNPFALLYGNIFSEPGYFLRDNYYSRIGRFGSSSSIYRQVCLLRTALFNEARRMVSFSCVTTDHCKDSNSLSETSIKDHSLRFIYLY